MTEIDGISVLEWPACFVVRQMWVFADRPMDLSGMIRDLGYVDEADQDSVVPSLIVLSREEAPYALPQEGVS